MVSLMTTFGMMTSPGVWITAPALLGIGVGGGIACLFIAAQAVLNPEDVSIGMAIMTFSQDFGESIFISIAQSIFLNQLKTAQQSNAPALDVFATIRLSANNLDGKIPTPEVAGAKYTYNEAVKNAFYLGVSLAAILTISGIFINNKSIKPKEE